MVRWRKDLKRGARRGGANQKKWRTPSTAFYYYCTFTTDPYSMLLSNFHCYYYSNYNYFDNNYVVITFQQLPTLLLLLSRITYHLPEYVWCPWCPCPVNNLPSSCICLVPLSWELLTILLDVFGAPGAPVLGITYHPPG